MGDLESIHKSVLAHYETKGARITNYESDNSNDFEMDLVVAKSRPCVLVLPIIVIGGNGGGMDQTLGNLNKMYIKAEPNRDIYWLDDIIAILTLSPNYHSISIDPSLGAPTCCLIPVGRPVDEVFTEGLRWNIDGRKLHLVSKGS